jgi:hypothetical protein
VELIAPTLSFELRRLVRHPAFAASLLLLGGSALTLIVTGFGPRTIQLTAPYFMAQSLGMLTLVAIFVLTFFVAHAALGDAESKMQELLFATPLTRGAWFAGRCSAVILGGFATMIVAAIVLVLAPSIVPVDPARVGSMEFGGALWALLVIVLPNLILIGAILFTAAALSGSSTVTAVAGIGIWALFWVTALLVDSPLLAGTAPPSADALARAAVLDPFGLSAFFEQTRYWTPDERNTRLMRFTGRLLINRVLWLTVAGAMLILAARRVAPRRRAAARTPRAHQRDAAPPVPLHATHSITPLGAWATWRRLTRHELRTALRSWPFVVLVLFWMMAAGIEIVSEITAGEYGARLLATTAVVVDRLLQPFGMLGTIVLLYFAGDIVWRDRVSGMHALTDATPAPALARLGSQLTALLMLPMVLLVTGLGVGLGIQVAFGHVEWRPMVLLGTAWHAGLPLLIFGVGVFTLQVIIPNRWVAMMGGIVLALAGTGELPGVNHPMLRFAAFPLAGYSDFDGFGTSPRSFLAFAAWWASLVLLLLTAACALRHHGHDLSFRRRLRGATAALGRSGLALGMVALLGATVSGVQLANALARTTRFADRAAVLTWRAGYERTYRHFAGRAHPDAAALTLRVVLTPREARAETRGTLTLMHQGTEPIDTILLNLPRDVRGASFRVPGNHTVSIDTVHRVALLVMHPAMQPGDSLQLAFAHTLDRGGVHASVPPRDITVNGTVLMHSQLVPVLGYRPQQEIVDPRERTMVGLTTAPTPWPTANAAGELANDPSWLMMDVTVGTDQDQVALAVGDLTTEWDSAGRRWFRYTTPHPVTPVTAVISARYAKHVAQANGTMVEVWHLPEHAVNVGQIAEAALTSIGTLSARLGPMPDSVLRIVELPRWSGFGAFALRGMVLFPEHRGFMLDARPGGVDLMLRRVAHEVAHQWWGHLVEPAQAEGSLLLVESLAKDAEQVVVGAVHGAAGVDAILAYDEDRYLVGRADAGAEEPALERLTDEPWLYYGKGSLMMHALRAEMGDTHVDAALREVIVGHRGSRGGATAPLLRSALLRQSATATDSAAVTEWFSGRAVWDVALEGITPAKPGYQVTVRAARQGDATLPMAAAGATALVTIVGYDSAGSVQWRGRVLVRDGVGTVTLPALPGVVRLVLDPDRRLLDRDRANNRRELPPP